MIFQFHLQLYNSNLMIIGIFVGCTYHHSSGPCSGVPFPPWETLLQDGQRWNFIRILWWYEQHWTTNSGFNQGDEIADKAEFNTGTIVTVHLFKKVGGVDLSTYTCIFIHIYMHTTIYVYIYITIYYDHYYVILRPKTSFCLRLLARLLRMSWKHGKQRDILAA